MQQIVSKTDGVPLFVEELTKSVVESVGSDSRAGASLQPLGIPATLQDSLMARLDRLGRQRRLPNSAPRLGVSLATIYSRLSHRSMQALQHSLQQFVDAELLYQRGVPPQATYLFKHALIQDTAYQSLLKSKRQQYHRQIAQVLEARFPRRKNPARAAGASLHRGKSSLRKLFPTGSRQGSERPSARPMWKRSAHLTKGLELLIAVFSIMRPLVRSGAWYHIRKNCELVWWRRSSKGR